MGNHQSTDHDHEVVEVKISKRQSDALLAELHLHADVLKFAVGQKAVVGSRSDLAMVARRVDDSRTVAQALGQQRRVHMLSGVLAKLAAASIGPAAVAIEASGEGTGASSAAPESQFMHHVPVKPLHPSKVARFDRYMNYEDVPSMTLTKVRKGGAQGRGAIKQAFASKAKQKAGSPDMVRGDKVFWHDEYIGGEVLVVPNDERTRWLRAGSNPGDKQRSNDASRAARLLKAKANVKRTLPQRIKLAISLVASKHGGKVRAQWIAYELVRDDLRVGRYEFRSEKMSKAHARYMKAAKAALARMPQVNMIVSLSSEAQQAAVTVRPVERVARIERPEHWHEWKVTPKRSKRSCECGLVERKQRGRWVAVEAKQAARVELPPVAAQRPRRAKKVAARQAIKQVKVA